MSLDTELLMLAGEDSDDAKESSPDKNLSPARSASPPKKRARSPSKTTNNKKRPRRGGSHSSSSSGLSEAPSPSDESGSAREASMDLGSSENEGGESIHDLYPLEGKYKDHDDMENLLAMNEIDREGVLAERAQQIERAQQDRHLRNLLKSRNAADNPSGSTSTSAGSTRRSTRTKSMPTKNAENTKRGQLDQIQRARAERANQAAGRGKPSARDESGGSRRSIVDDLDEGTGFADEIYTPKKEMREIQLADINRARIGRTGFAKLCDYPGFDQIIIDSFVRVSLYDKETNSSVARIAQIKGIVPGKAYTILDGRRRTDKHLSLCHGKAQKPFPMDMMSDSPFTEAEFARFKRQMEVDNVALPTLSLVQKKAEELRQLDSRSLSQEELEAILAKRNKDKDSSVLSVLKRGQLRTAREAAVANGDEAEISRIDKEIQHQQDENPKPTARAETQMDRLAKLNIANRRRNTKEIRQAELEEKKDARLRAARAKATGQMCDPFARVKTAVKFMHDSGEKKSEDGASATTATSQNIMGNGIATPIPGFKRGRRGGVDEVIASYDFGIDIEI